MFRLVARHFMMKCRSRRLLNRAWRQTGGERVCAPWGASFHDEMLLSAAREPGLAPDWLCACVRACLANAPFHGAGRGGLVPGHGVHARVRACPPALCVHAWLALIG